MPAWKTKLHPTELVLVSAYVASLRGRNEAGRQAEGSEIAAWPTVAEVSSDSGSEIRIDP
jgi:cytochrome c oxidase cbb3-type subunit 3